MVYRHGHTPLRLETEAVAGRLAGVRHRLAAWLRAEGIEDKAEGRGWNGHRHLGHGEQGEQGKEGRRVASPTQDHQPPPGEVPSEHLPTRRDQARERFADLLGALTAND